MRASEFITEARIQLIWLKGKLRGSYTDEQLQSMGAFLQNGQWVMPRADYDRLTRSGQLQEQELRRLNELTFMGSPCTKDCSGHRAGYAWSKRKGGKVPTSWSKSFNNGAAAYNAHHRINQMVRKKITSP